MRKLSVLALIALTIGACKKEEVTYIAGGNDTGRKIKIEICCNNDVSLTSIKVNSISKHSNDWVTSNVLDRLNSITAGDTLEVNANHDLSNKQIKLTVIKKGAENTIIEAQNNIIYIVK